MPDRLEALLRLMLVVDERLLRGRDLVSVCQAAEQGGVTSIQIPQGDRDPNDLAKLVRTVLAAVRIPVVVGGRADVAIACRAAGAHLGPADIPVPLVRRIAPKGFIVGASVGSSEEVENGRGADYWVIGPWRAAGAETGVGEAIGADGFASLVRRAEGRPCVAIGGVQPGEVDAVIAAGGVGVAVGAGILRHEDVTTAARAYRSKLSLGSVEA